MEATGKLVALVGEFAASVQPRQYDLDPRNALFWMLIHWHTATIVTDRQRTILVQNDFDPAGVTRNGLIDAIINNFLCKMIGATGIGIHARPFLHRLKSG